MITGYFLYCERPVTGRLPISLDISTILEPVFVRRDLCCSEDDQLKIPSHQLVSPSAPPRV